MNQFLQNEYNASTSTWKVYIKVLEIMVQILFKGWILISSFVESWMV